MSANPPDLNPLWTYEPRPVLAIQWANDTEEMNRFLAMVGPEHRRPRQAIGTMIGLGYHLPPIEVRAGKPIALIPDCWDSYGNHHAALKAEVGDWIVVRGTYLEVLDSETFFRRYRPDRTM